MTDDLGVLVFMPLIIAVLAVVFLMATGSGRDKNGDSSYSDRAGENLPGRRAYRPKG